MVEAAASIDEWVKRIQKARNKTELLKLLEEFRKFDWTDIERQKISHTYMRVLDVILKSSDENSKQIEESESGNDGPVWYEKM